jgi:ribosomal protein L37E
MVEIKYGGRKKELLEKLMFLNREAFSIPETYDQQQIQLKAKEEYDKTLEEYLKEPYIINNNSVQSLISYKVDFGIDSIEFKHGQTNAYSDSAKISFSIKYDNDGFPCELSYITQDSYLHNAPLIIKIPIQVPKENIMVKKEIVERVKEVPSKELKVIETIPIIKCSRCGADLTNQLRYIACANCGMPLNESLKPKNENLDKKQNNNKKRFKLF